MMFLPQNSGIEHSDVSVVQFTGINDVDNPMI